MLRIFMLSLTRWYRDERLGCVGLIKMMFQVVCPCLFSLTGRLPVALNRIPNPMARAY